MSIWKYAANIAGLANCPPLPIVEADCTAFRFVFSPIDSTSFLPVGVLNPARAAQVCPAGKCLALASLSMFTSEEAARDKVADIESRIPQIKKRVGTHVARLTVAKSHGAQTPPNDTGHFSFFEYEGVDLVSTATLLGPL
jgi:hypothetical protein